MRQIEMLGERTETDNYLTYFVNLKVEKMFFFSIYTFKTKILVTHLVFKGVCKFL